MPTTPLATTILLLACHPAGIVYPSRLPTIDLNLPCPQQDTAQPCTIALPPTPLAISTSGSFTIANSGQGVLELTLTLNGPDFSIVPAETSIDVDTEVDFTITYQPTVFEQQQAEIRIEHNALGSAIDLQVLGSTDDDADDDGYRHELAEGGDDCNDFNASVHPGATETWYDGVDQDCLGDSDYDMDGDGHDIITHGGDDCDDEDETIHPGAIDIDGDNVDQDCDGEDD